MSVGLRVAFPRGGAKSRTPVSHSPHGGQGTQTAWTPASPSGPMMLMTSRGTKPRDVACGSSRGESASGVGGTGRPSSSRPLDGGASAVTGAAEVLSSRTAHHPVEGLEAGRETAQGGGDPRPGGEGIGPSGLEPRQVPRHVAVIMDGNSRWASGRGLSTSRGHEAGVHSLRAMVRCCSAWGVRALTVFAFSAENWMRSEEEVSFLLSLFGRVLSDEIDALGGNGVRLHFVGDIAALPPSLRRQVEQAEARTATNTGLHLTLALGYGGRQDIVGAARSLAARAAAGELDPSAIDERLFEGELATGALPAEVDEPDLLIRTSGEQRLSNFLLWQMAYTELYFSDVLWPDFHEGHFREALQEFAARDRRYGGRRSEGEGRMM